MGLLWVLGVIGTIRLHGKVEHVEYIILCDISSSGGFLLLGVIHFCGNIPKGGRELLTELQFNYEAFLTSGQRKVLMRYARSLNLFGIRSGTIRLLKHNAIYLYFGALINFVVTILVANKGM
jgi:hypothetical protein